MALNDDEIQEIREIFDHYDGDGNGVIDRDEFTQLLKTLDPDFTTAEIDAGLDALDENHDGVIQFDEFIHWWGDR